MNDGHFLKSLRIQNFRGIASLEVTGLTEFNIFVGKNNCGKTSLLEAIWLGFGSKKSDSIKQINAGRKLPEYTDPDENWGSLFRDFDTEAAVEVEFTNQFSQVSKTTLQLRDTAIAYTDPVHVNGESASVSLSQIRPRELYLKFQDFSGEEAENIARMVTDSTGKVGRLDLTEVTTPIRIPEVSYLGTGFSVSHLYSKIGKMIERRERDQLNEMLKLMDPMIRGFELIPDAGGGITLKLDTGRSALIPFNLFGSGFCRYLQILIGIAGTENGYVLIDEIDEGIHYSVMQEVLGQIAGFAKLNHVQVFATTHSYHCLTAASDAMKNEPGSFAVVRMEREGERHRAVAYTQDEIEAAIRLNWEVR